MRVALLIAGYAVLATLAYAFLGNQVAPCLGLDNTLCYEQWMASRPWFDKLLDTPIPEVAGFLLASGATLWLARRGDDMGTGAERRS